MGFNKITEADKKIIATRIQDYIDTNGPRLKRVNIKELAPAILNRQTGKPFNVEDPLELARFRAYTQRLKQFRIIRYQPEEVGGVRRYSINPVYLDKTGVVTHIPTPKADSASPVVVQAIDEEKLREQGKAFIEEEMKKVEVELAVVSYAGTNLEMTKVNLYQLYKIASSIDAVCEKRLPDSSTPVSEIISTHDDSEEETEEDDDSQFEFDQTETESDDKPF